MQISKVADIFGLGGFFPGSSDAGVPYQNQNPNQPYQPVPERKTLFSWEAPTRSQKKDFGDKLTRSFTIIGAVIALILVILQEFVLILVIVSIIFVSHVLAKVPPGNSKYSITTQGIYVDEEFYYWYQIKQFYFTQYEGLPVLAFDVVDNPIPRVFATINISDQEKIKHYMDEHAKYLEEEPKSTIDRTYESFVGKFNI